VIVTLLLFFFNFRIHPALLILARFNHNASMLDCDEIPESSGTGKKKYIDLF
jgi:hypothetical protein